jgi:XisH protein
MPRLDIYHDVVRHALERDGWTITHDPLPYKIDADKIYIDLGAERVIAASKGTRKIAVEIKTFAGPSPLHDLQSALGQYILHKQFLLTLEPDRGLVLAVPAPVAELFKRRIWEQLLTNENIIVLVYDALQEVILEWLPQQRQP